MPINSQGSRPLKIQADLPRRGLPLGHHMYPIEPPRKNTVPETRRRSPIDSTYSEPGSGRWVRSMIGRQSGLR